MSLAAAPPLSREALSQVAPETWRALGERFRALSLSRAFPELFQLAEAAFEPASRDMRIRELRRAGGAAADLLRLFWLGDAVARDDASNALGTGIFAALASAGIVREHDGSARAALRLSLRGDDILLAEDLSAGPDAVMAVGPSTTLLLRVAQPEKKLGSLLDLGCGSGALAIGLAPQFQRVVASDINDRATALAAANAAVAGLSHVDARAGDLFAPVEGMTFDRIVCQPPFMPASGGASVVGVTRTGGSRGDELPLRAMAESVRHLAPGGRAIFAVNWVIVDDEPIMDRVRAAVGPEPDILVIDIGDLAPATLAVGNSMYDDPSLGAKFQETAYARFLHYQALGARSVKVTLVVLTNPVGRAAFTATFELSTLLQAEVTARDIDAWLESHAVIAGGSDAIARARYVLRPDVQLARLGDGSMIVDTPLTSPLPRVTIAAATAEMLDKVRRAKSGAEAIKRHVKDAKGPPAASARAATAAIEAFLRKGVLEIER